MLPFRNIIIAILLAFCAAIGGCTKKQQYKEYKSVEEMSSGTYIQAIKDTSFGIAYLSNMELYKDSLLFFVEGYSSELYKYSISENKIVKLSKKGPGPGEFSSPKSILIKDKDLIINDCGRFDNVQVFDFNGMYKSKIDTKYKPTINNMCIDNSNNIYFVNAGPFNEYYVTDIYNKGYAKVPKCIYNFEYSIESPGAFIYNNMLYFMNPYEYKIFTYNINSASYNDINLQGLNNAFNYEPFYNNIIPKKKQLELVRKERAYSFSGLRKVIVNNRMYFLLGVVDMIHDKHYSQFYNESGQLIMSMLCEQPDKKIILPYDIRNDKMYCYYKKNLYSPLAGFITITLKKEVVGLFN